MDRITAVLAFQWRAYWRRFRRSPNRRVTNAGVLIPIGGLVVLRFFQQLPLAASQLSRGETPRFETLLILVFLAWMVPVMAESRRSIASRSLLHFPLTHAELFGIRVGSVFCSPLSWIIFAPSLALCYPIAASEHPVAGLIGLLVFLSSALFFSLTITHLLQGAFGRRLSFVALLVFSAGAGLIWIQQQTQIARSLRSVMPDRLAVASAVSPAPFRSVAALIAIAGFFAALAFRTFRLTLRPQQSRRAQRSMFLTQLPGKFGGLLKKDLRYSRRLLDLYVALPIVILFDIYLESDAAPSALALSIVVAVLFFPCVALAFNCFGLDSALGFDRYTLFPLSGKHKLFSKNLAFAATMLALFGTILPFVFWRLGPSVAFFGLMEFAAVTLTYLACGNWFSVRQPYKMQSYRFASGGSLVDLVLGTMFASSPAAVAAYLLAVADTGAIWKIGGVIALSAAIYIVSLSSAGRALESRPEEVRRALL